MIKIIEKDFLDDKFIISSFTDNISLNEDIKFNKNNIYYFGNYKKEELDKIKKKLIKNKKRLLKAIENNVKFIICGNSIELFNNSFYHNDLNIFTNYYNKRKYLFNKKTKHVSNLENGIEAENFRYKNMFCINNLNKLF